MLEVGGWSRVGGAYVRGWSVDMVGGAYVRGQWVEPV